MKITFEMSGGFVFIPAHAKPTTFDTQDIAPDLKGLINALIVETSFFNLPAKVGTPAKGAADYRTYIITVEDDARKHTVTLTDPIADTSLSKLVSHLQNMASSLRP